MKEPQNRQKLNYARGLMYLQECEECLWTCWDRLIHARRLAFTAESQSKQKGGWNGQGSGVVVAEKESESVLIFHEKGSWISDDGDQIAFTNTYRWTLDLKAYLLSLEHLRRGVNHPVFLFHLAPQVDGSLKSVDVHKCKEDTYSGHLFCEPESLKFEWTIVGPKKNEHLVYYYRAY